jgi:hypothetical protein
MKFQKLKFWSVAFSLRMNIQKLNFRAVAANLEDERSEIKILGHGRFFGG